MRAYSSSIAAVDLINMGPEKRILTTAGSVAFHLYSLTKLIFWALSKKKMGVM